MRLKGKKLVLLSPGVTVLLKNFSQVEKLKKKEQMYM